MSLSFLPVSLLASWSASPAWAAVRLMTPILIFFFGVKPYLAVGTDLLFAAVTKAGGTVSLARQAAGALAGGGPARAPAACLPP